MVAKVQEKWCEILQLANNYILFSSVQSLSHVQLFVTPWTTAHQASLAITNSQSLLKLMSIESMMPSNHLILCHPLLLLVSTFPSIRVFSNKSALRIRWPKYQSFSFSISPSDEYSGSKINLKQKVKEMRKTQKLLYKWISKIFQMLILGYEEHETKYLDNCLLTDALR